jgi:hemerythrin superfamily protein
MAKRKAARSGGRRSGGSTSRRAGAQRRSSTSTGSKASGRRSAAGRRAKSASTRRASSARSGASSRAKSGSSRTPSAIRLLKQDHQEVSQLLERFERASGGEKTQIAQRICTALTVHAQIEEELLYPAARRVLEDDDRELVAEATVEHASVKDLISQIEGAEGSDELYDAKVKVLGEYVKHHVKEEETELFRKLQQSELDLEALGGQLAARKAELQSSLGMERDEDDDEVGSSMSASRSTGGRSNRPSASRNT